MEPPWVLLDVDGPFVPDRPTPGFREFITRPWQHHNGTRDLSVWLNPEHGEWVRDLADATGARLAWASMWEDSANLWIGPPLGIPSIPFVPIAPHPVGGPQSTEAKWKVDHVVPWVNGVPFVWFDDEHFVDKEVAERADAPPHFVVHVSGTLGLQKHHIEKARVWLEGLRV